MSILVSQPPSLPVNELPVTPAAPAKALTPRRLTCETCGIASNTLTTW